MKCLATFAFILLIIGRVQAAGNLADGPDADLIYNFRTGFVTLDPGDTPSQTILSFGLTSRERPLRPIDNKYLPIFRLGEGHFSDNEFVLIDFSLEGRSDPIRLGPIFPPGMRSPQELFEFLEVAKYTSALQDGGDLDLIVVPEPGAGVLASLSCLCIAMQRACLNRYRRDNICTTA